MEAQWTTITKWEHRGPLLIEGGTKGQIFYFLGHKGGHYYCETHMHYFVLGVMRELHCGGNEVRHCVFGLVHIAFCRLRIV